MFDHFWNGLSRLPDLSGPIHIPDYHLFRGADDPSETREWVMKPNSEQVKIATVSISGGRFVFITADFRGVGDGCISA
jgi:hypothetical protein